MLPVYSGHIARLIDALTDLCACALHNVATGTVPYTPSITLIHVHTSLSAANISPRSHRVWLVYLVGKC